MSERTGLEIAVIGMDGRFPGAKNIEEYWQNLKNGVESISFFSDEELRRAGIDSELLQDPNYIKAKGVLDDIEYFDSSFFDYTPREAELMDPQMRLLHEVAYHALEDAGYEPMSYSGLIGVYVGAGFNVQWLNYALASIARDPSEQYATWLYSVKDFVSTRLSYSLNLKGPSYTIDTACSTSLVTIDVACKSLLTGACDMALAGGVSISLPKIKGYVYQDGQISSPDGHCRAFDAQAKGTVEGDGIGLVVLKRLEDALEDGDHIYAIIRGSATNNDGIRKIGYTAPSIEGQAEVIKTAHFMADVEPETISYVEAHGTGTALGDPIEMESLSMAFATDQKGFCRIGSVKTNIGHLNTAAGVAGLIKTVLSLNNHQIPPSLHFKNPNPKIDFANSPFVVNTELREWSRGSTPRLAGVSSFGIGGTNAHVVLEEAPESRRSSVGREWNIISLSAKTETALQQSTENLVEYLKQHSDQNLTDVAYTLHVGRRGFKHRRSVVCSNIPETIEALASLDPQKVMTNFESKERPVIFLFSGQGSQYINMGRELYKIPEFKDEMDHCFDLLQTMVDYDLKEILYPEGNGEFDERIHQTQYAQPAIFILEYALSKLLIQWGIKPQAMIGHSIGEFTAACLAGVFSLQEALSLVVLRGQLMQKMLQGSMLSVPISEDAIKPLLLPEISLAAVNGVELSVVSGPHHAVDEFARKLEALGYTYTRLHTSHAFHSQMMEPILDLFAQKVAQVTRSYPTIPYISNVTGTWITDDEATNPQYWAKHLRQTVRFADGLSELFRIEDSILVEIGAGNALSSFARKHPQKQSGQLVVNTVRHIRQTQSDLQYLFNSLGCIWNSGVNVDWRAFYAHEQRQRLSLPTYPFERKYHFKLAEAANSQKRQLTMHTIGKKNQISDWLYQSSWEPCNSLPERNNQGSQNWLLFTDDFGFGQGLADQLKEAGDAVVTVTASTDFEQLSEDEYALNPQKGEDYQRLLDELKRRQMIPQHIVHFWSLDHAEVSQGKDELLNRGFYSLLNLVQTIGKERIKNELQISVVTNHTQNLAGETVISPFKRMMVGLCKVIPQEYPYIRCRCIDVQWPAFNSWQQPKLNRQLWREFTSPVREQMITYRGNQRLIQKFVRVNVDGLEQRSLPLAERGVYLITGGLGRLGLHFAEHLAKRAQGRLILLGRSAFPAREQWMEWVANHPEDETTLKIRKIQELEAMGAEVMILQADAADLQQMQNVIAAVCKQFGNINGVIHAAGIVKGDSIRAASEITKRECAVQFTAKVDALMVLKEVLAGMQLDFCVIMSSLASILGGLGYSAYAAANAFIDGFVSNYNQSHPVPWTSINWDGWRFPPDQKKDRMGQSTLDELLINPEEGLQVFDQILSLGEIDQVIVSTGDLQKRIAQWVEFDAAEDASSGQQQSNSRPDLTTQYVAPDTDLEITLCKLWQDFLGIEQVGIHDNFFELGASSLDLIQINGKLKKIIDQEIPVVDMFTYPTISSLIQHFSSGKKTETQIDEENNWLADMDKGKSKQQRRKRVTEVECGD